MIQAVSALQAAHYRSMVHRDIKPANLMLARQEFGPPIVKVLDLGLALLSDNHAVEKEGLTSDGQVMGTIDYMAPEQATDSHTVDIRADVYALGTTLFALLTGASIFQDCPNLSLLQKVVSLDTVPVPSVRDYRPGISEALADVVHKMLAAKPEDRYATPAEAAAALKPFAAGGRNEHPPRLNLQEDQQIQIAEPFERHHLLRVEVASPQCCGMNLQELLSGTGDALRARIEPIGLEDVLHGVS